MSHGYFSGHDPRCEGCRRIRRHWDRVDEIRAAAWNVRLERRGGHIRLEIPAAELGQLYRTSKIDLGGI